MSTMTTTTNTAPLTTLSPGVSNWEALHMEAYRIITSNILDVQRGGAVVPSSIGIRAGEKLLRPLFQEERKTLAVAAEACGSKWVDCLVSDTPRLLTDEGNEMNPAAHYMLLLNECNNTRRKLEAKPVPIGVVTEIKISESGRLLSAVDAVSNHERLLCNMEIEQLKSDLEHLLTLEKTKTSYLAKYGPPTPSALYLHYQQEIMYKNSLEIEGMSTMTPPLVASPESGLLSGKELTAKCAPLCRDSFCQGGFPFLSDVVLQEAIDRTTERVDVVETLRARVPDLQRYRATSINDSFTATFKQVEQLYTLAAYRARRKKGGEAPTAAGDGDDDEQEKEELDTASPNFITPTMHALSSREAVKLVTDARHEIQEAEKDLLALVDRYPFIAKEIRHLIPSYTKERISKVLDMCLSSEGWFWDYRNKESRVNVRMEKEEAQREMVALDLLVKGGVPDAEEDQLVPYPQRVEVDGDAYGRSVLYPAPPTKHTNLTSLREKLLALETGSSPSPKKLKVSAAQQQPASTDASSVAAADGDQQQTSEPADEQGPVVSRMLADDLAADGEPQNNENSSVVQTTSDIVAEPPVTSSSSLVVEPTTATATSTLVEEANSAEPVATAVVVELPVNGSVVPVELDSSIEDLTETNNNPLMTTLDPSVVAALDAELAVTSSERRDEVEHQQLRLQIEYRQHGARLFENEDKQDIKDPCIHRDADYYNEETGKPHDYLSDRDRQFLNKFGRTIFSRVKGNMLFADLPASYTDVLSAHLAEIQRHEIIRINTVQRFEGTIAAQLFKIKTLEAYGVSCALVPSTTYELGQRDPLRHSTLLPIAGSIDRSERLDERTNFWLSTRASQYMMTVGGGIHSSKYLDGPAHFMYNTRRRDVFLGNFQVSVKPITVKQFLNIANSITKGGAPTIRTHRRKSEVVRDTERQNLVAAVDATPRTQTDTFTTAYFEPTIMAGRLEAFVEHIRKRRCDARGGPSSSSSDTNNTNVETSERDARELGLLYDDDTIEVPYFVAEGIAEAVGGIVCPVDVWEAAARGVDSDPHTHLPREFLVPQMDVEEELGVERLYWHVNVKGERISRDVPGYSWRINEKGAAKMRAFKGPFGHALLGRKGYEWNSSLPLNAATDADMNRQVENEEKRVVSGSAMTARELLKQQMQRTGSFVNHAAERFSARPDVVDIGVNEARFGTESPSPPTPAIVANPADSIPSDLDSGRAWLPRELNHRYIRQALRAARPNVEEEEDKNKKGTTTSTTINPNNKHPTSIAELFSGENDAPLNKLREEEGCAFPITGAFSHVLRTCFDHNTQVLYDGEVITRDDMEEEEEEATVATIEDIIKSGEDEDVLMIDNNNTEPTTTSRPATSSGGARKAVPLLRALDLQPQVSRPATAMTAEGSGLATTASGRLGGSNKSVQFSIVGDAPSPSPLKNRRQLEARRRAQNAKDYDNEHSFSGPAFHTFSLPNRGVPVAAFRIAVPICDKAVAQVKKAAEIHREQTGLSLSWEDTMEALAAGLPREGSVSQPTPFDKLVPDVVQTDPSYGTSTWVMGPAGMDLTFGYTYPHRIELITLYGMWGGIRVPMIGHASTRLRITTKTFRDARAKEGPRSPGFTSIQLPLVGPALTTFISALTSGTPTVPITATPTEVGSFRIVFTDQIIIPAISAHLPNTVFKAKITMFIVTDQQTGDKLVTRATIEKIEE